MPCLHIGHIITMRIQDSQNIWPHGTAAQSDKYSKQTGHSQYTRRGGNRRRLSLALAGDFETMEDEDTDGGEDEFGCSSPDAFVSTSFDASAD